MTPVEICNLGLSAAKATQITSLDEDTAQGRAAKAWYAPVRDLVLGDRIWSFAKKQYVLDTPDAQVPLFRWARQFALPSEVIRVHRSSANPDDSTGEFTDWELHGRNIYTNAERLYVTAVRREEDATLYSPGFCVALGLRLGSLFAVPFSGSRQLRADLYEEYKVELGSASGTDGSQGRSERVRSNSLANRRL